jgi:hypothetical protein
MGRRPDSWTKAQVAAEKDRVRLELQSLEAQVDPRTVLAHILSRISALDDDASQAARLAQVVYAISALIRQYRHGGLKGTQVRHLADVADGILKLQKIVPKRSPACELRSDLHFAISQNLRREGDHRRAAWEHELASYYLLPDAAAAQGFFRLAGANRALSLGQASAALAMYDEALRGVLAPDAFAQATLSALKALRLARRFDEHARRCVAAGAAAVDDKTRAEIAWETICRDAVRSGDLRPMVRAVKKKDGPHYRATYLTECSLWAKALETKQWLGEPRKIKYVAAVPELAASAREPVFAAAVALDDAYDRDVPLPMRIHAVGDVLMRSDEIHALDKRMLVLVAAARWLLRSQASGLAAQTIQFYRGESLRVTDGASDDCLGVAADLVARVLSAPQAANDRDGDAGAA